MKKRYIQPEVEHISVIAMQRLMEGTGGDGGGLNTGSGLDNSYDPFGSAPYRY